MLAMRLLVVIFFEVIILIIGLISYHLKHYRINSLNIISHTLELGEWHNLFSNGLLRSALGFLCCILNKVIKYYYTNLHMTKFSGFLLGSFLSGKSEIWNTDKLLFMYPDIGESSFSE